jgi:hypothetical protein
VGTLGNAQQAMLSDAQGPLGTWTATLSAFSYVMLVR